METANKFLKLIDKEFAFSTQISETRVKLEKTMFEQLCYYYLQKQVNLTNRTFIKTKFLENFINNLYHWLIFDNNANFNPYKGFLLTGANRTGKTTIAKLILFILKNFIFIQKLTNYEQIKEKLTYKMLHAIELQPENYENFNILFIDDIGKEPIIRQINSKQISVFADMISLRYFAKIKSKKIFYDIYTTNLTINQINQIYGIHTATRIFETMNIIHFDKDLLNILTQS